MTSPFQHIGSIGQTLLDNGFSDSGECTTCTAMWKYVKVVNGRTIEIKVKGQWKNDLSGRLFQEIGTATIYSNGNLTVISKPEYTQTVLQNLGYAKTA
jgi:hypothetical protein